MNRAGSVNPEVWSLSVRLKGYFIRSRPASGWRQVESTTPHPMEGTHDGIVELSNAGWSDKAVVNQPSPVINSEFQDDLAGGGKAFPRAVPMLDQDGVKLLQVVVFHRRGNRRVLDDRAPCDGPR